MVYPQKKLKFTYIDVRFAFHNVKVIYVLNQLKAETKIDLIYLTSKYTQTLLREPPGGYICVWVNSVHRLK